MFRTSANKGAICLLFLTYGSRAAEFDHALIIVTDDLGTDKVGAYADDAENAGESRPETPTIDLLAAAGVRFSDAWANPMCSPTRATLYAGEYAYRTGIGKVIDESSTTRLGTTQATLAKLAGNSGVRAGLFGKWHLGETSSSPDAATATPLSIREYPIQVGFYQFAGHMEGEVESYTDWLYTVSTPANTSATRYTTTATDLTESATDRTTSDALAWLTSQSSAGQRRIGVVSYNLPHATMAADGSWSWADAATSCGATASADEVENFRAATECVDDAIAELLAGTPDLEHTLVVFIGDNGTDESVSEGAFADGRGKGTIYENGIRVPMILVDGAALADTLDLGAPVNGGDYAFETGLVVSTPASVVDIYATVADYLSLSSTSCTVGSTCARDSVTMRAALTGDTPVRNSTWTENFSRTSSGRYTGNAAVRSGDYKLIVKVAASASSCRRYELYDLAADRWELDNLYNDAAYATEQAALLSLLSAHTTVMSTSTANWMPSTTCS